VERLGGSRYEDAVNPTRIVIASVALALAAAVAGCGHDIGDECRTSADCDPNGSRACDLSQPGGYCTISGCDESSCPDGSRCIRYFPEQYLTNECDPACEDLCDSNDDGMVDNTCAADELCLNSGVCARRSFEQRACAKACGSPDDCRGGYECRQAGTRGSMLLSTDPKATTGFCAPMP
jgi:hypothetical protein